MSSSHAALPRLIFQRKTSATVQVADVSCCTMYESESNKMTASDNKEINVPSNDKTNKIHDDKIFTLKCKNVKLEMTRH